MLRCSVHNNENYGSDTESLPNLDEFLAFSIDPNILDNEEEIGGQENADSLGLEFRAFFIGCH